jgi:hypothetical protein
VPQKRDDRSGKAAKRVALAAFQNAPLGPPSKVQFHPDALNELEALKRRQPSEWLAVANVVEKLKAIGLALGPPHSSAVRGLEAKGAGLRELRPRQGRSPTRPLYHRFADIFVILAIAPEAQADGQGFDAAVAAALARMEDVTVE